MKIEKISDTQIRCTLNKDDLIDRQLRISELAYGTEKAKALFRDMMQQASCEFGFEADDIPLMIEAIPVSPECLILVITKVEDPDELDTRFSKFTDSKEDDQEGDEEEENSYSADEVINCYDQINELLEGSEEDPDIEAEVPEEEFLTAPDTLTQDQKKDQSKKPNSVQTDITKVYSFGTLEEMSHLSMQLSHIYNGINTLYKDPVGAKYYLVIHKSQHTPEEFNRVCNIISEYGRSERTTYASPYYYEEHYETIVNSKAIQILSKL